ncbi:MAG: ABC transporter ATP-binding protein [Desulfobacterales bacterium]
MEAMPIGLDHITKTFVHRVKGRVTAVDDVHLEVQPGELLTLLGPSGCGKTTTLRMIAGFEKPTKGRILFGRDDVTGLMVNQRNLGFVFQNYALFPHLSIFENVAYGLRVKGLPAAEIEREVKAVLGMVGLEGYEQQFPNQLSGGEQQRVALARAIVIRPRVLLFDEPLSNLDAKLRVHTRSEIRNLQKTLRITSIYVTHDQEEAMAISDRIAVMNHGRIVQVGSAESLYYQPANDFVARFIGRINSLPATVQQIEGRRFTLVVFGHAYLVTGSGRNPAAGDVVSVYVRPELIDLVPDPSKGHFPATVKERTFLGEKVEYVLEVEGHRLGATAFASESSGIHSPGRTVGVCLGSAGLMLLPEEVSPR